MSAGGGKPYRSWKPQCYRQQAHSPVSKLPEGDLVFFGSIVGYSAYAYALDRLPVAVVSVYPYVNAIVAVALGW